MLARSLGQGRWAGIVSALGIAAGGRVHITAAALRLSALLATPALAFTGVKAAGPAGPGVAGVRRWR